MFKERVKLVVNENKHSADIQFAQFFFFCYTTFIMENIERYKHLNKFLKDKFGERTLKICIDGGFTCPNRDGKSGIRWLHFL